MWFSLTRQQILIGLILLLGAVALFLNLGLTTLHFEEPRRAIVALEMELSGNWWVPKINGEFYYNKPPIYNWLLILFFKVFGYAEWVVRLPTVLSTLLLTVIHYQFFRNRIGLEVALLSSLFFITSVNILFYFSFQGEIDLFYSLIVYLQVISIIYFFDRGQLWRLFLVSYFLCAIGLLTKGLPSLAFQALTLLIFFIFKRQFWRLVSVQHIAGIALLGAIVTAFFWQYSQFNDPLYYIIRLVSESTRRTAVGETSWWDTISHLFEFPVMLFGLLCPWIFLLFWSQRKDYWPLVRAQKWLIYGGLFLAANLPLYWLSAGTRERYLYMFLPFFLNLVAFSYYHSKEHKSLRYVVLGLLCIVGIGGLSIPFLDRLSVVEQPWIASAILLVAVLFLGYTVKLAKGAKTELALAFVALMFTLRIVFNLVIMPVREAEALEINYKGTVQEILARTNGASVDLAVPIETRFYAIPFTKDSLAYNEIRWPPYQISYYLSSANRSILNNQGTGAPWVLTEIDSLAAEDSRGALTIKFPSKGQFYLLHKR